MITRTMVSVSVTSKTWCARMTRSRMAIAFFLFMLANCVAQTALHTHLLLSLTRHRNLVKGAIDAAGIQRGFTVLRNNALEICYGIPTVHGTTCYAVDDSSTVSPHPPPGIQNVQCAKGLTWLENYLRDSGSEEVVYLFLQSWLVIVSLLALTDESIPHLIVVLVTQVVNAGWILYRTFSDLSARRVYQGLIVDRICRGFDILGGSWKQHLFRVPMVINAVVLLGMFLFVLKLVRLYLGGTLSSIGSTPDVGRMLMWRLWMRVFLQFTAFFALASAATWYDKRMTSMTAPYSTNIMQDVAFYVVVIILLPWLVLGMCSISNENHVQFLVHAFLSICLLLIFLLWLGNALFRYEYWTWLSFACVTTVADVLLIITCVLSIICRFNFGRGLAHFLFVERALQDSGFACDVFRNGSSDPASCSVTNLSRAFSTTPEHPTSPDTVMSPASATWLFSRGCRREEKSQPHAAAKSEEWTTNMMVISTEDMALCGVESISDDGSDTIVI